MRRFLCAIVPLALALAGCATHPAPAPAEPGPTSIMLERGPCFGACPTYAVTIEPSGAGHFDGKRFVAITGMRDFASSPETFERIRTLLASYRPESEEQRIGPEGCTLYATDHASWTIRWGEAGGGTHTLHFDTGCHDEQYKALAEALRASRGLLPIDAFVGRRDG